MICPWCHNDDTSMMSKLTTNGRETKFFCESCSKLFKVPNDKIGKSETDSEGDKVPSNDRGDTSR